MSSARVSAAVCWNDGGWDSNMQERDREGLFPKTGANQLNCN